MKIKMFIISLLLFFPTHLTAVETTVTLATLDWAPYIDDDLPGKGYVYEVVATAFERSGFKADIQFFPWARAVYSVEHGEVDALFPEYYDEERKKTCVFSDSFPGGPVGLFKRKSMDVKWAAHPQTEQTKALQALKKHTFGVVRGYVNTKEFDQATFLKKEAVRCDELNLKKLDYGRLDFIFIDKFVALYLIKTKFPQFKDKLEFMEPAMEIKPLYLAFSRKSPDYKVKLQAFNEGLDKIISDGTIEKIMKKHGF